MPYRMWIMMTNYICADYISSFYTNILFQESIDLNLNIIYTIRVQYSKGLGQYDFITLLNPSLNDLYFKFNGSVYEQIAGLLWGYRFHNIFLYNFESEVLSSCPVN